MAATPAQPQTYSDFVKWMTAMLGSEHVREQAVEEGLLRSTLDERLVQCIWHELMFGQDLRTVSGRRLIIRGPGRWNTAAGPDFQGADLQLDDEKMSGDVEIHVNSADWRRHRHNEDFEYNGVALHAFLYNTDDRKHDVLQNGRRIERFEMAPHLFPDLDTIRQTLNPDEYYPFASNIPLGLCHRVLAQMKPEMLQRFIVEAGRERLRDKIQRYEAQLSGETLDQVFYQALLTSIGHKGSKILMFLLAKRAPLAELIDLMRGATAEERALQAQAILLHVANLVPPPGGDASGKKGEPPDEETLEYLNRLHRHWAEFSGYFSDRLIPPTKQWFSGTRPVNFPPRRLAGVSMLLAQRYEEGGLLDALYARFARNADQKLDGKTVRRFVKQAADLLIVPPAGYWAQRYTIGGRPAKNPQTLIGADRAASIVFNAMLPILCIKAEREKDQRTRRFLERVYDLYPSLSENAVVRFMRVRLFGENWKDVAGKFTREVQNQALHKMFQDCCNNNERTCDECAFFRTDGTVRM